MKLSANALTQLRLTMKSLGTIETTSTRMTPGNLRFTDPQATKYSNHSVDYVIYPVDGVVRRIHRYGKYASQLSRLNPIVDGRIQKLDNEAALMLLLVRGVINYRG